MNVEPVSVKKKTKTFSPKYLINGKNFANTYFDAFGLLSTFPWLLKYQIHWESNHITHECNDTNCADGRLDPHAFHTERERH